MACRAVRRWWAHMIKPPEGGVGRGQRNRCRAYRSDTASTTHSAVMLPIWRVLVAQSRIQIETVAEKIFKKEACACATP